MGWGCWLALRVWGQLGALSGIPAGCQVLRLRLGALQLHDILGQGVQGMARGAGVLSMAVWWLGLGL